MSNVFSYVGGRGLSSMFRVHLILGSGSTMPFWEAVSKGLVTPGTQADSYFTETRFLVASVVVGGMRQFFGVDLKPAPFKLTIRSPDDNGFLSWSGRLLTKEALLKKLDRGSSLHSSVFYQSCLPESTLQKILSVEHVKRRPTVGGRVLANASI